MIYEAEEGRLCVSATGDSLLMRRLEPYAEPEFLAIRDLLRDGDVAFTNLELVLGEMPDYPAEHCGGNWLGVEPGLVDDLTWMGFNLFGAANNHAGDFGTGGALSTMAELRERRLRFAGLGENLERARQPGYLETGAGRVSLIAVTSTWPPGSAAGEQRRDMIGRPGVSVLGHKVTYALSQEKMDMLRDVADEAGIEARRRNRMDMGYEDPDDEGEFTFLEDKFTVSGAPGTFTEPDEKDLQEITRWIRDAVRQADFCFVSLHAHESGCSLSTPAEFIQTACRAFIDAGADGVFGHGPHVLRGIEIYRGRPILYSLGNFIMQSSTMQRVPAELYQRYEADPLTNTPADVFDNRREKLAIRRDPRYWESAVARLDYAGGDLGSLSIHPVHLGVDRRRPQKGRPVMARGERAMKILADLKELSRPYGTVLEIDASSGTGHVEVR